MARLHSTTLVSPSSATASRRNSVRAGLGGALAGLLGGRRGRRRRRRRPLRLGLLPQLLLSLLRLLAQPALLLQAAARLRRRVLRRQRLLLILLLLLLLHVLRLLLRLGASSAVYRPIMPVWCRLARRCLDWCRCCLCIWHRRLHSYRCAGLGRGVVAHWVPSQRDIHNDGLLCSQARLRANTPKFQAFHWRLPCHHACMRLQGHATRSTLPSLMYAGSTHTCGREAAQHPSHIHLLHSMPLDPAAQRRRRRRAARKQQQPRHRLVQPADGKGRRGMVGAVGADQAWRYGQARVPRALTGSCRLLPSIRPPRSSPVDGEERAEVWALRCEDAQYRVLAVLSRHVYRHAVRFAHRHGILALPHHLQRGRQRQQQELSLLGAEELFLI